MPDQLSPYLKRKQQKREDEARILARQLAAQGIPVDPRLLIEPVRPTRNRKKANQPDKEPIRGTSPAAAGGQNEYEEEPIRIPTPPPPSPSPPPPPRQTAAPRAPQEPPLPDSGIFEDDFDFGINSPIPEIQRNAKYIKFLKSATLDGCKMQPEDIERLKNPGPDPLLDINDANLKHSLGVFFSLTGASRKAYEDVARHTRIRHPEDKFLSFDQCKRRIETLSGVVPIQHDMCINTCMAFTGPHKDDNTCSFCGESRYEGIAQKPRRRFTTIPIGPVIQALYHSPGSAKAMKHRARRTAEIFQQLQDNNGVLDEWDDIYCGSDYLEAVDRGEIQDRDIVLQLSIDGAQLFRDKASDCWIYIWIIHNLSPDLRYKKSYVIPGGFIPGPKAPEDSGSFLLPGLGHLSAIQRDKLSIWDADLQLLVEECIVHLFLMTADGPIMSEIMAQVGHSGRMACRLFCLLFGRFRRGDSHYYPVLHLPNNYDVVRCSHGDISEAKLLSFRAHPARNYKAKVQKLVSAPNRSQYNQRRLQTGLTAASILNGIPKSLGVARICVMDTMHLIALNDPDLFVGLWRGTIKSYGGDNPLDWDWRVLIGDIWISHGQTVADATSYIPSSFHRAPRNPAEKINSGYKAWEYVLWMYGLGPGLFYYILPEVYWKNFCKFVRGIRLLGQRKISRQDLEEGHRLLLDFSREFEELYYQRNKNRIHFVRQSIHLLTHIGTETVRMGPPGCYAQWTMETLIGSLGEEIRSDVDPYGNITQRGVIRAQLNCIQAMYPQFQLIPPPSLPSGSLDCGNGLSLRTPCDDVRRAVSDTEAGVIGAYWTLQEWPNRAGWDALRSVKRWGRVGLPNGQIAHSQWATERSSRKLRVTSNVTINGNLEFVQVRYYFKVNFDDDIFPLALGTRYSPPDAQLLEDSYQTVYACSQEGEEGLVVFPIHDIEAVVAMVPFFEVDQEGGIEIPDNLFFLVEKPGLDITKVLGTGEDDDYDDDDGGLEYE
ncbi:hypothetical protein BDN72DRAFT_906735 [Pluteus cervinus]|uniref:Uncharacterized protein n=1 Tax=Pluteus cervinus TaxID=181527 RepID=A0ACD2ZZ78_9AGAR|nr:hypothetical protein BDN72DRAFT_906735 [Pluteus cervinus]